MFTSLCRRCHTLNEALEMAFDRGQMRHVGACRECGGPLEVEDRGSALYLWRADARCRRGPGDILFYPTPGFERVEVSCPLGWSLRSHPDHGVVLTDLMRDVLTADGVYDLAANGEGFRVRG